MEQGYDERSSPIRTRLFIMEDEGIVNKIAQSSLSQVDLEEYLPKSEVVAYDIAQNLYEGLVLREKDFRTFIAEYNWAQFKGKIVAVHCSVEAIIPNWAFMLVASKLNTAGVENKFGSIDEVKEKYLVEAVKSLDSSLFKDKKVLIKGCGSMDLSPSVYVEITNILQPMVSSLMFGESCSTVPVYKSRS